jgi:CO/xanthine dehydrogenase Mo-binding subunit/CO/xanthine dehydrogenase FAD-binding subunit
MRMPRVRHTEWQARTDGNAAYTADLPGKPLVGALLRSPHRHARIVGIDTTAAERSPGVHAVVTAADLPDVRYADYGTADRPALARDTVRFVGQEVAAVAAETPEQARAAVGAIEVRYAPLPRLPGFEDALRPGAAPPHPGAANIAVTSDRTFGDAGAARARVAHTVSGRYRFGSQAHACMEPHTTLASWADGRLHVWTPTQGPRTQQREIARMVGLETEQVRIHRIAAGGDFGSRVRPGDVEVLTAALAIKAGGAVRLSLTRADEFAHTKHRHDFVVDLTTTADDTGHLVSREADILVEAGGFTQAGGNELNFCGLVVASQYRLTAAHVSGTVFYTNRRAGGAFRGAGGPQAVFAVESQLDELAEQLGDDPIDLRIRNANRTGDTTITGWEIDSSRLVECLRRAREEIGWDAKRELRGSGRGVGIAAAVHVSGAVSNPYVACSEARVELGADGSVRVRTGAADPGTGQPMVAAIIVAEQLGLDVEDVEIVYEDTDATPYDPGAGASKGTFMTGHAAQGAGRAAAEHLRDLAAEKFAVPAASVRLDGGRVHAGEDSIGIGDLVAAAPDAVDGTLSFDHRHQLDLPFADPSGFGNLSPTYAFAAHAVEVEVDRATGRVHVVRVVAVHDSGTIVNPTGARGQVVGGVAMALGATLGEEIVWCEGRVANANYTDYALPRAADVPDVETVFLESDEGCGPLGAKGLAEIALSPVPAAVANAVAHAVGVRVRDLPITPDKLLPALHEPTAPAPPLRRRIDPQRLWTSAMRWAYPRGLYAALHHGGTRLARRHRQPEPIELRTPDTVAAAAAALRAEHGTRPLGGGTDLLITREQGVRSEHVLVDVTGIAELTRLERTPDGDLHIGGAVTLDRLAAFAHDHDAPALAATVDTIASPQIRAAATVAGNLCQEKRCRYFRGGFDCYKRGGATCPCYAVLGDHRHYHAALGAHRCQATTPSDLSTTLTALDAVVHVRGSSRARTVPVAELYRGPGETVLRGDEMITHLVVPAAALRRTTVFEKVQLYDGGFALIAACVSLSTDGGTITQCRAVLGAIAPTPYRAVAAEELLVGPPVSDERVDRAAQAWTPEAHALPGTAWKLLAASAMLARCIRTAIATEQSAATSRNAR